MSWTLKLSPVKRKRDRKDPTKRVGDAAYDYAILSLLKRVREAEERARQQVASGSVDADDDEGDGWESDNEASSSRLDVEVELPQTHDLEDGEDEWPDIDAPTPTKPRRTQPSGYTQNLYRDWRALLPHLVRPLASFQKRSALDIGPPPLLCSAGTCANFHEQRSILCLYWNYFETRTFEYCRLHTESLPVILVENSLFPTSPREPRVAVSIDLLSLYQSLLEHSGTSNSAFCSALQDFYVSRGFWMLDAKGVPMQEPFRRGFGYATKWYGCVRLALEDEIDSMLSNSRAKIPDSFATPNNIQPSTPTVNVDNGSVYSSPAHGKRVNITLTRGRCSDLLQQRCSCLGGDVHVAVDCNFNQRHRTSAGDCPHFYDPRYILSKHEVDEAGVRIEIARNAGAKKNYSPKIPDIAVDEDEKSFDAADEKKEKTHGGRYDDTGLAALVCRHDVPLFLANVDTPGEQQKYAVALIDKLASHLPAAASIAVLYDIGCVMDRSINLYDIFPPMLTERLVFATSAMHSYGHQWACQLVYNPRLMDGLGLTDGEGVERFWSCLRKLIGITRSSARRQRIYLLDRQAAFTAKSIREDLGGWIRRKVQEGVEKKGAKARADLESCGKSVPFLRQQWADQRQTQTSICSHAPARLKKELDAVLTLQAHADTVESAIQATRTALKSSPMTVSQPNFDLSQLSYVHQQLCNQIDQLYASLNVGQSFPELASLDVTFVQTLLLARDLKMNIRKRAIGTFFEWDRLDQATGGREQALGTKLHQQTRKSISRRKPALLAAIRKFNGYVGELEQLATEKNIQFPLPRHLSTDLAHLRNDDDLMQDVWMQMVPTEPPAWLVDANVQQGIRAVLQLDRCLEERRRLGREADNLLTWFERELVALQISLQNIEADSPFLFPLKRRYEQTCALQHRWKNPLVSDMRWHAIVQSALRTAHSICHGISSSAIHFVPPTIIAVPGMFPDIPGQTFTSILREFESDYDDEDNGDTISNDESDCLADILDDLDPSPSPSDVTWEVPSYSENDTISVTSSADDSESFKASDMGAPRKSGLNGNLDIDIIFNVPSPECLMTKDVARYRPRCKEKNWAKLVFDADALRRLYTSTALLNDDVMNGCAALLSDAFPESSTVLFSTYDLAALRDESESETIWRYTRKLKFWMYTQWVIPIHRKHQVHWTVATVNLTTKTLELFDSLADALESERDIQDVLRFVEMITACVRKQGYELPPSSPASWTVTRLIAMPIQHNGYDCGVWVLSQIRAVLRGYRQTAITESDISKFRTHCLSMVLALATWNSMSE
ncbi:uncharacterized protein EV420DRAFT_1549515 [Desarmillaria tabescens]|uniref:Ubiquitin-like protease family profile domain-containing protein n=1 Tax=Armillaria tabescens TaxID=1929756 RepID=A0AA39KAF7_ARMTA|nr:uncharacterized protein EV420DRAFT_1549515 [Desarmillaria tabescens]KAK0457238.1 hypothetical protein EV420DRAFT_1549515 [Desarmillaria tabescens]